MMELPICEFRKYVPPWGFETYAIPCERRADMHDHVIPVGKHNTSELCPRYFDFLLHHDWRCRSYSYLKTQEVLNQ
jgi:hypothetical protein